MNTPSTHRKEMRQAKKNIERLLWASAGMLVAMCYIVWFVIGE